MTKFSKLWAIHCEEDDCPVFVGWAPSEAEAKTRIRAMRTKAGAAAKGLDFWTVRMTRAEVDDFKAVGAIPKDA